MSHWKDGRYWLSMVLIAIFASAYAHNPSDEAMKGAIIASFAAAYGYWLGSSVSRGPGEKQ